MGNFKKIQGTLRGFESPISTKLRKIIYLVISKKLQIKLIANENVMKFY